jgi:uncharacterized Zn-binding protein involved in type VI secretion
MCHSTYFATAVFPQKRAIDLRPGIRYNKHRATSTGQQVDTREMLMPPAARISDMHTCPMVTGVVPHVGGPILPPGCPTVLIGGMPAARVGDMCTCTGPPDTIIPPGCPTVLIGGQPAARVGDQTSHGGVIVGPGALTVMIG